MLSRRGTRAARLEPVAAPGAITATPLLPITAVPLLRIAIDRGLVFAPDHGSRPFTDRRPSFLGPVFRFALGGGGISGGSGRIRASHLFGKFRRIHLARKRL